MRPNRLPSRDHSGRWYRQGKNIVVVLDSSVPPLRRRATFESELAEVSLDKCRPGEGPPAAVPDPEGRGLHPLVYRGATPRRSRNPTVGDAQILLNNFLAGLNPTFSTCRFAQPGGLERARRLLAELNAAGENPLVVDCRFGPNTERATKLFQLCKGIVDDGKIGPVTWPLLEAFRRRAPVPPVPPVPPIVPPFASLAALLKASMLLAADPRAPFRSRALPSGRQKGSLWEFDVSLSGGAMTANNVTCIITHAGGHRHAAPVLQEAKWEPVEVALTTGGRAVLPLDPSFLLGSFGSTSGAIAARSHAIWRLASQIDVGTAAIFAYNITDPADPRPITDIGILKPARPNETPRTLWALVCCELVLCRTRADFEPAGILDAARLYPLTEVLTNADTSTIRAVVNLRRPTRSSMDHPWANGGRHLPGLFTDRNNEMGLLELMTSLAGASGAALPTWDNIFDYVDKNGAARTQSLVVVDRTLTKSRTDTTHRRTLDRTKEANAPSAVLKLPRQGAFDNVHIAPQMEVSLSIPLLGGIPSTAVSMAPVCAHDCFHMHWRWSQHYTAEQNLGWGPAGPYTLAGAPMVRPNQTVTLGMTSGVPSVRYEAVATAQPVNEWMVVMPHGAAYAIRVRVSAAVLLDRLLASRGLPAPVRSAITSAVGGAEDQAFAWFYFFVQFWPALLSSPRLRPINVVTADVPFLSRL